MLGAGMTSSTISQEALKDKDFECFAMRYRSRTDIVAQILEAANDGGDDGATQAKIMYKAFLPYAQLKEYL
jgi:predicted transcriptional regulator